MAVPSEIQKEKNTSCLVNQPASDAISVILWPVCVWVLRTPTGKLLSGHKAINGSFSVENVARSKPSHSCLEMNFLQSMLFLLMSLFVILAETPLP